MCFKCDICGKFISYDELMSDKAVHKMVYPDSDLTIETWETYHVECNNTRKTNDLDQHKCRISL